MSAISGSDANDILRGGDLDDDIHGHGGDDILFGGAGNDWLIGGSGADHLSGGTGIDGVSYDSSSAGVIVVLGQSASHGDAQGDVIGTDIEILEGSAFNDRLSGDDGSNTLFGNAGDDVLNGHAGDDVLYDISGDDALLGGGGTDALFAGDGDDKLQGDAGNDWLDGGAGQDWILGGAGLDTVSYAESHVGVRVDLGLGFGSYGDASGDLLESIEAAYGSAYDDILIGSTGADTLDGSVGADKLHGGAGDDILIGGLGVDLLDGGGDIDTVSYARAVTPVNVDLAAGKTSGGEDDVLVSIENVIGSAGDDILNGSSRANSLEGGDGSDILRGGAGRDVLAGGLGGDRFEYAAISDSGLGVNADRITDFIRAQGDRIDLSDIDAKAQAAGNQAFTFIGSDHYSHNAGELRFAVVGGETTIAGDIDGDGASDFQVVLTRIIDLQATDFFL